MFEAVRRDVKYAVRQMRVTPVVTGVAVLSLALGVGANTAIFSLVNAMLLKGLPVHEPGQLAELNDSITNPIWEQLRERQDAFVGVLAHSTGTFNLARRGQARTASSMLISGGGFDVLGLQPALGRLLTAADDRRDGGASGPSAVISYGFWQREYGGLPTVIGQTIWLDGHPFSIVGVTPRGFTGLVVGESFDVAVPINTQAILRGKDHMLDERGAYWIWMLGRLSPGQSIEQAQTRLRAVQVQVRQATLPADWAPSDIEDYLREPLTLQDAGGFSMVRRRYTRPLLVLMGIVGLVLLIACANLANLLLARAMARQRELAVRLSIGASRGQLIRQLLVESLVLASVSAAAGFVTAQAASRLLVQMISTPGNTVTLNLTPDWRVLAFALALAAATALLFGVAPAWRATAVRPAQALQQGGRTVAGGSRRFGLGPVLVGAQVALSLVLVFAAALFVRSFVGLASQPLGFQPDRVLTIQLDMRLVRPAGGQQRQLTARIVERLRAVPGVTATAAAFVTPVSSNAWMLNVAVPGYTATSERDARSFFNAASPDYLRTLGMPLVGGRDFTADDRDGAPRVAIVNETFVRKFLPGQNPLGVRFKSGTAPRQDELTIVGVAGDAKYRFMREESSATVLVPMAQQASSFFYDTIFVRTDLSPAALTTAATAAIAEVHPDVVLRFRTLSEVIGAALLTERVVAMLSGFFGMLALLLAMIGLYGVMWYAVTRRRNEIGVRMALGAAPARVLRMVMRDVAVVSIGGVVAGAAAGLAGGRFVAALLYGLAPTDATTLVLAATVLTAAAMLAGYLPARRAASVDPLSALRQD